MLRTASPTADASYATVRRLLARVAPDAGLSVYEASAPLERDLQADEPPRIVASVAIAGDVARAYTALGDPSRPFAAFVDGVQHSRIAGYAGGLPIVWANTAAVVRVRRARRLETWKCEIDRHLYVPLRALPAAARAALASSLAPVIDTFDDEEHPSELPAHPLAFLDLARRRIQTQREQLERRLATEWCVAQTEPLYVDGPISSSAELSRSEYAVGVVKSHRSLYANPDALQTIFALRTGEHSSVFRIAASRREPVASFYLRLRDPAGRGPLFGLVRVEMREHDATLHRAGDVARAILAERAPLALPDHRWDTMAYGIRDCEEFLTAVSA